MRRHQRCSIGGRAITNEIPPLRTLLHLSNGEINGWDSFGGLTTKVPDKTSLRSSREASGFPLFGGVLGAVVVVFGLDTHTFHDLVKIFFFFASTTVDHSVESSVFVVLLVF